MSRFKIFVLTSLFLLMSCGLLSSDEQEPFVKLIPDDTLFIVSLLEVTADTVHHYPEVYVGSVRNLEGNEIDWTRDETGLWWPVMDAQVQGLCSFANLSNIPIENASVYITGPLDLKEERTVMLSDKGHGIYGDINYELNLIPLGEYQLKVLLPNGSSYQAITALPELPYWFVPDSIDTPLKLEVLSTGNYYEESIEGSINLDYQPASTAIYTTGQINYNDDHESFDVPVGGFLYENRGNFLREGGNYLISNNQFSKGKHYYGPIWTGDENGPIYESMFVWMNITQLNTDMSERWFYHNIFRFIGMDDEDPWSDHERKFLKALLVERDTTYLFDISNILKIDENGEVLPKAQTDAIGVFGGYSAAYRTTTLIPIRSWDPDTLDWGKNRRNRNE